MLDATAKAAYRRCLAALDAEIDDAGRANDPHRAERAHVEREALVAELSRAVGLGGRDRRLGDAGERARKGSPPGCATPPRGSSAPARPSLLTCC